MQQYNSLKKNSIVLLSVHMKSKHGNVFYFFQRIVRFISYLNFRYKEMVRSVFPTQWARKGSCVECGACCVFPSVTVPGYYFHISPLIKFIIYWHEYWYGFMFSRIIQEQKMIEFTCTHYTGEKKCDDYTHRPQMCRNYPEMRTWFSKPVFFESCGFRSIRIIESEVEDYISNFKERNRDILCQDSGKSDQSESEQKGPLGKKGPE